MDRRGFLKKIIGGGAAALVVPSLPPLLPEPVAAAAPVFKYIYGRTLEHTIVTDTFAYSFFGKIGDGPWRRYIKRYTAEQLRDGIIRTSPFDYDEAFELTGEPTIWEGEAPCFAGNYCGHFFDNDQIIIDEALHRIEYGYLVEQSRTNLLLHSEDLNRQLEWDESYINNLNQRTNLFGSFCFDNASWQSLPMPNPPWHKIKSDVSIHALRAFLPERREYKPKKDYLKQPQLTFAEQQKEWYH